MTVVDEGKSCLILLILRKQRPVGNRLWLQSQRAVTLFLSSSQCLHCNSVGRLYLVLLPSCLPGWCLLTALSSSYLLPVEALIFALLPGPLRYYYWITMARMSSVLSLGPNHYQSLLQR